MCVDESCAVCIHVWAAIFRPINDSQIMLLLLLFSNRNDDGSF